MQPTRLSAASTELSEQTTTAWLRLYAADVLTLLLGSALVLRFWHLFFGADDGLFLAIFAGASICEIAKRAVLARLRWQRPSLFRTERRFDLMAALVIGTAPWPITLPLHAASPLWSMWQGVALSGSLRLVVAGLALGVATVRLLSTND